MAKATHQSTKKPCKLIIYNNPNKNINEKEEGGHFLVLVCHVEEGLKRIFGYFRPRSNFRYFRGLAFVQNKTQEMFAIKFLLF